MAKGDAERRQYLRIEAPLGLRIITEDGRIENPRVKNISPVGIGFETGEEINDGEKLELKLELPSAKNPIHIQGKVIWHKKTSLEDGAPFEVGCEFVKIEEDNKNTFLKFLCDTIYKL